MAAMGYNSTIGYNVYPPCAYTVYIFPGFRFKGTHFYHGVFSLPTTFTKCYQRWIFIDILLAIFAFFKKRGLSENTKN